jgi:hypothetical protein
LFGTPGRGGNRVQRGAALGVNCMNVAAAAALLLAVALLAAMFGTR